MGEPKKANPDPADETIRLLKRISTNTGQTRQYAAKLFYMGAVMFVAWAVATIGSCSRGQ